MQRSTARRCVAPHDGHTATGAALHERTRGRTPRCNRPRPEPAMARRDHEHARSLPPTGASCRYTRVEGAEEDAARQPPRARHSAGVARAGMAHVGRVRQQQRPCRVLAAADTHGVRGSSAPDRTRRGWRAERVCVWAASAHTHTSAHTPARRTRRARDAPARSPPRPCTRPRAARRTRRRRGTSATPRPRSCARRGCAPPYTACAPAAPRPGSPG